MGEGARVLFVRGADGGARVAGVIGAALGV
jgi:hypothetical protein